jgi:hypothetical protein
MTNFPTTPLPQVNLRASVTYSLRVRKLHYPAHHRPGLSLCNPLPHLIQSINDPYETIFHPNNNVSAFGLIRYEILIDFN